MNRTLEEDAFANALRTVSAPTAAPDLFLTVKAGARVQARRRRAATAVGALAVVGVVGTAGVFLAFSTGEPRDGLVAGSGGPTTAVVTAKPTGWGPIGGADPDEGNAETAAAFTVRPTICQGGLVRVFIRADGQLGGASGDTKTTVQGYPGVLHDVPDERACSQEIRSITWRDASGVVVTVEGAAGVPVDDLRLVAEGVRLK